MLSPLKRKWIDSELLPLRENLMYCSVVFCVNTEAYDVTLYQGSAWHYK